MDIIGSIVTRELLYSPVKDPSEGYFRRELSPAVRLLALTLAEATIELPDSEIQQKGDDLPDSPRRREMWTKATLTSMDLQLILNIGERTLDGYIKTLVDLGVIRYELKRGARCIYLCHPDLWAPSDDEYRDSLLSSRTKRAKAKAESNKRRRAAKLTPTTRDLHNYPIKFVDPITEDEAAVQLARLTASRDLMLWMAHYGDGFDFRGPIWDMFAARMHEVTGEDHWVNKPAPVDMPAPSYDPEF